MLLNKLTLPKGARKNKKRLGRGVGSGHGKTSCRGHKGAHSRSGGKLRQGFEGGQMPLIRRIPKRGFSGRTDNIYQVVNIESLNLIKNKEIITPEVLKDCGLVKKTSALIKILGDGQMKKGVTISAHAFSSSAKKKIEEAGGKAEIIKVETKPKTKENKKQ
ncbi:MAG: 50S ribosomal protein L15 [Candidatus Omnitrophota bacterium]